MPRLKGLRTLLVAISPLHNEFIPFAKVTGVIAACRDVGIDVFPWVNDFVKDLIKFDRDIDLTSKIGYITMKIEQEKNR
jgi:hypothetical protein